jgi:hypothetical protein
MSTYFLLIFYLRSDPPVLEETGSLPNSFLHGKHHNILKSFHYIIGIDFDPE